MLSAATSDALSAAIADQRRRGRLPALSAAIGRAGRVAWADAVGITGTTDSAAVTAGHAFRIGSIAKPMVAVAVLRLVEAGTVRLADTIGLHLPDAPAPDATLAHLLTHTGGLPAEPAGPWWERAGGPLWETLTALRPLTEPGERFHYSNVGFAVLGRLLEVVHDRRWDEVLHEDVWVPLAMTSTGRTPAAAHVAGFAVHPHADLVHAEPVPDYLAMGPAGEVWSTPSDLVRFASWLVAAGPGGAWDVDADDASGGPDVLALATRRRMCAPRVIVDEPGRPWTTAQGLGPQVWHADGVRAVGHGGSVPGFQAGLQADCTTGDVVAVCSSSTTGGLDLSVLLAALAGREPFVAATPTAVVDPTVLSLTGTWYWGPAPYTLTVNPGGTFELAATADGGRGTVFTPTAVGGGEDDTWIGTAGGYWLGERLRVVERDGRPVALDVGTFHFTRIPYDPGTDVPGGLDPAGWHRLLGPPT